MARFINRAALRNIAVGVLGAMSYPAPPGPGCWVVEKKLSKTGQSTMAIIWITVIDIDFSIKLRYKCRLVSFLGGLQKQRKEDRSQRSSFEKLRH